MTSGLLRVMGLEFANRVGVAAGYDRDGSRLAELSAAGFAFIEVGTINVTADTGVRTALQAVVVNLTCYRLRSAPWSGVRGALIGVSIGTLREAFDAVAAAEIAAGAHALAPLADYLVVNLSRPGSACRDGAVGTQTLRSLLERVRAQVDAAGRAQWRRIPLLVKVAARPGDEDIVPEGARLAAALGYDGMVIAFERWPAIDAVCDRIAAMRARLGRTSLIAVGGVRNADIANRYLRAGADLVQVYSAVAESGPAIAAALIDGYRNVAASRPGSMT